MADWKDLKGEKVISLLQKRFDELAKQYWTVRDEWAVLQKAKQQLEKDITTFQKALDLNN